MGISPNPLTQNSSLQASLIILNWNGKDLLSECLPSVIEAVEYDGVDHEILVVDNGSTDGSVEFLHEHFPQVNVLALDKNYNFIGGNNAGARAAKNDILVFLNNDMFVDKGFLRPLLDGFIDSDVFAVSSQIFFHDPSKRREETGKTRATWQTGLITFRHDLPTPGDEKNRYVPAFWLGGGSSAVDRKKFLEIGGFDTLLHPLYVEDVDLSYQAWKRGWKVLFCPESKVLHKHRSTSGKLDWAYLNRIIYRNRLLFTWKNITSFRMLFEHLLLLPLLPLRRAWGLSFVETAKVLLMAASRLPEVLSKNIKNRRYYKVRDEEVFRVANSTLAYKEKYYPPRTAEPGERLKILFICPYFPSLLHGGGVRMYHMIRQMSKEHDVSLLSFWEYDAEKRYFPELEKMCQRMVPIHRVPTHYGGNLARILPPAITLDFGDPQFGQVLEEMLSEEDYDVVQCEFLQMAYQIPELRREALFLTEHEVQHAAWLGRLKKEKNFFKKIHMGFQWARWLNAEIHLAKKFDRIAAVTEEDAWALKRFDPSLPVEVIHTCVDTEYYQPEACPEEPNSLMFVGNFRHNPNLDSAMFLVNEVLPKVQKVIPTVKLYIVGGDPTPEIQALHRPDSVIVTGWVEDMRPFMNKTNLFVVPIRLGVGIRNKILEAWAMGRPVITTPIGCFGLNARHRENIWIAQTSDGFADGIVTLLADPGLRAKIGKNGHDFVERERSWQVAAAKQIHSYREVLIERGKVQKHG